MLHICIVMKTISKILCFVLCALFLASLPQSAEALSIKKFEKAKKNGRAFGEFYFFDVKNPEDGDYEKIRKLAYDNDYYVSIKETGRNDWGRQSLRVYFIEQANRAAVLRESDFLFNFSRNKKFYYKDYWVNKELNGHDFKSQGVCYLYNGYRLEKFSKAEWTGGVKGNLLDGRGDGLLKDGEDVYYSFSGTFKNGIPQGDVNIGRCKRNANFYTVSYDVSYYQIKFGETSEGMTLWIANDKKFGFANAEGKLIGPPEFSEVKSGFVNGIATVKYGLFWIKINKNNKAVEVLSGQGMEEPNLPNNYFQDTIFNQIKKLHIPRCKKVPFKACMFMGSIEELTFEEGVEDIGWNAFAGCKKLKKVTLPNSIKFIASEAFEGCSELETVIVPSSFQLYGSDNTFAFSRCAKLKSIFVRQPNGTLVEDTKWHAYLQDQVEERSARLADEAKRETEIRQKVRDEQAQVRDIVTSKINVNTITQYIKQSKKQDNGRTFYDFKNIAGNGEMVAGQVEYKNGKYVAYELQGLISTTYIGSYKTLNEALVGIYYWCLNVK